MPPHLVSLIPRLLCDPRIPYSTFARSQTSWLRRNSNNINNSSGNSSNLLRGARNCLQLQTEMTLHDIAMKAVPGRGNQDMETLG